MNTKLKSILLSSALITTTFGAAHSSHDDEEAANSAAADTRGQKRRAAAEVFKAESVLPGEVWAMMYAMLPMTTAPSAEGSTPLAKQLSPADVVVALS